MNIPSQRGMKKYTYADYLNWPEDERWEIINGEAFMMSPAPSSEHQRILMEIASQLHIQLRGKSCSVFPAPFDVRFPRGNEEDKIIDTVVQPDLVVICDRSKIDKRGCQGAPDLIIEIISYSTAKKDLNEKFNLYELAGVREYWVVFQAEAVVEVYQLNDNSVYIKTGTYQNNDRIKPSILPQLEIDLQPVFQNRIIEE